MASPLPFASLTDLAVLSSTIPTTLATNGSMPLSSLNSSCHESTSGFEPVPFTLFDRCRGRAVPVQVVFVLGKAPPPQVCLLLGCLSPPLQAFVPDSVTGLLTLSLRRLLPVSQHPHCIFLRDTPGPRPALTCPGHLICTTVYYNESIIMERGNRSSPGWGAGSINWM